jgi:dTDP-4-amino-4,6-dideoxygalactose transaminase
LVTTNDAVLADRMQVLRNQGMRARYQYEVPGHNYRLTDLCAAVGIPQLRRLEEINDRRALNAAFLSEHLQGIDGLTVPVVHSNRRHVWHQYTVRIGEGARVSRDEFVDQMNAAGVGCGVYYPRPVFDYDCYRDHPRVVVRDVSKASKIASEVASLPVHPKLSDADLDRIVEAAREVLGC